MMSTRRCKTGDQRTVWHLRYVGYGGVDPVGLYAFYFAIAFGIISILGLAATTAQTYTTFKALNPTPKS